MLTLSCPKNLEFNNLVKKPGIWEIKRNFEFEFLNNKNYKYYKNCI